MVRTARHGSSKIQEGKKMSMTTFMFVLLTMLLISTVALLMLLAIGTVSLPVIPNSKYPTFNRHNVFESERDDGDGLEESGKQWIEILSWEPRAFLYHNFLSKEECEHLIASAKPHMRKSTVADDKTGESIESRARTSTGMFFWRGQDEVIRRIEKRIADFTFLPVDNGEGLQVLHYEIGQKYDAHRDYFYDDMNTNGGQRIATVLMYLTDVEKGGETVFPAARGNFTDVPWWNELSECGKTGLAVKPKRGNALLFWNMRPNATTDPSSLHRGCPVIKGDKWSSTKWLHFEEFKE